MNVAEIIGHQHLRILALEETIGARELEISLLKEKVMKLTPAVVPEGPSVPMATVDAEAAVKTADDL